MVVCNGCLRSSMIVHFLVLMFGAGAWIAVNGVWVELPIIVQSAPENWGLPSYLTVIAQVANIGPIIVTVMQTFAPQHYHRNAMIYSILFLGTTSCLLLSFFWDIHVPINGTLHSLPLFILWFIMAFVDCTSSVTFLPFMTTFQTIFLTTYFIGEGLSGFLPSIFALIQGVQDYECVKVPNFNTTGNSTCEFNQEKVPSRFSTGVFFILLCIMMLACSVSFLLLNYLGVARKFYSTVRTTVDENACYYNSVELQLSSDSAIGQDDTTVKPRDAGDNTKNSEKPVTDIRKVDEKSTAIIDKPPETSNRHVSENSVTLTRKNYIYFLSIIAFINALSNGVLPAVSSYSSLPYGPQAYHLAATLGNMANPVACLVAVFLPMHSFIGIGIFTVISTGFGAYLMFLAATSPCPVLVDEESGKALMILAQIFFVGFVSFVKVSIAQIFRKRGHPNSLVWYGAVVQAGSLVGAFTMFPLVNIYQLFQQFHNPCCQKCPYVN